MGYSKALFVVVLIVCAFEFSLAASKKDKPAAENKTVDSGSFGVFVNGRRVATETFNIQQNAEGSTTTSQFKIDDGSRPPLTSDWKLTASGDLKHYEWNDGTGKSQTTIEPGDQLLHQQITVAAAPKPITHEYILPASTPILDDYSFVHREVLTWRFLATGCEQSPEGIRCKEPSQYGVLIPQQQTSAAITIQFKGMETVTLKGQAKQMGRFELKVQDVDWQMWMDGVKLVRILIPADNTEVVRD